MSIIKLYLCHCMIAFMSVIKVYLCHCMIAFMYLCHCMIAFMSIIKVYLCHCMIAFMSIIKVYLCHCMIAFMSIIKLYLSLLLDICICVHCARVYDVRFSLCLHSCLPLTSACLCLYSSISLCLHSICLERFINKKDHICWYTAASQSRLVMYRCLCFCKWFVWASGNRHEFLKFEIFKCSYWYRTAVCVAHFWQGQQITRVK